MDETRQSNSLSGIPRLSKLPNSKLPVPRTPSVLNSPSRESLISGLRNPKLRSTPSRSQLAGTVEAPATAAPAAPSRTLSRRSSSQFVGNATKVTPKVTPQVTSKSRDVALQRPGRNGSPLSQPVAGKSAFARSLGTRKPSLPRLTSPPFSTENSPIEPSEASGLPVGPVAVPEEEELGRSFSRTQPYKPRPSLSERTVETLAQLPSSPAVKGRASAFYDPESARKTPRSRPGSSHQSDGSNRTPSRPSSRPGSSSGPDDCAINFRASTNTYRNPLSTIDGTPTRGRGGMRSFKTPSQDNPRGSIRGSATKMQPPATTGFARSRTPSPGKRAQDVPASRFASKTIATRSVRPRPSLNGLFKKPSMPTLDRNGAVGTPRKVSSASQRSSATSCEGTNPSNASTTSTNTAITTDSLDPSPVSSSRKSSAALREQIAKAKAAKRETSRRVSESQPLEAQSPPLIPTDTTFDFGLSRYPFGQQKDDKSDLKVLQGRIGSARTSGRLNIAAMGLREIPKEVMDMYNFESIGRQDGSWAESVDLTRFVAADNELEMIDDSIFPDLDREELADTQDNEDDAQGNIFGGLETLDLHGNVLIALPMGMRRLSLLTSLNLSQNRLANNCLEVISQITSLKDLKLGGNLLYGPLDPCFSGLGNLEILDLHGNNIASLPSNFGNLSRLRILNISENCFEALPFEILATLPLTELLARKNQLSGTLVADTVEAFPSLQSLDVSANQLTQLMSSTLGKAPAMPSLHQLCVSMNRLQSLPDISTWTNLITLSADENSINAIPDGFASLDKLRSVDFSSNDIRVIPPEVGRMENLAMLRLSGNPLRDKKFCSIGTDDMKAILATRLEPVHIHNPLETDGTAIGLAVDQRDTAATAPSAIAEQNEDNDDSRSDLDDFATPPTSAPQSPARSRSHTLTNQTWPVKTGGILDRSHTQSTALHPVICSKVAAGSSVREVQLHHNLFTALPDSLSFFAETLTSLSLSHNKLVGETYLGGESGNEDLDLPALKELNLASNHITSLSPLALHLRAPRLQKLDVSFNRIAALPPNPLRNSFPQLAVLLISNNHLIDLDPETIKGLSIVDAANNDISHLNPRLGLLSGTGGLERLDVSGNRFRVPRWNVLERGTEATLRWLRGRVPVAEMAAWKADGGDDDGEEADSGMADLD